MPEKDVLDTHIAQWTSELQRQPTWLGRNYPKARHGVVFRVREEFETHRVLAKKELETQLAHLEQMYASELEDMRMKTQDLETRHSTSLAEMNRLKRQIRTLARGKKANSGAEIRIQPPTRRTVERVQSARNRTGESSLRLSAWEMGHVDYPALLDHALHFKGYASKFYPPVDVDLQVLVPENMCGEIRGQTAFVYPNGKLLDIDRLQTQTREKDSLERFVDERTC